MTSWYDRQGNPLPSATSEDYQRIEALLTNKAYKRVAEDTLPDGKWVSTVWLGIDHSFDGVAPLIFETMVFASKDNLEELDVDRYTTEDEALEGHYRMVKKWKEA